VADALILAGAVAKGAWTAGALRVLTEPQTQARLGLDIRRIAAASSGAINGSFLASRLRDGSEAADMPLLEELWIAQGDFASVFDVSLRALAARRGISTSKKVRALLERHIPPRAGTRPIDLAVVVTNIDGEVDVVDRELATTYERCVHFTGDVFGESARLEALYDAVVASAAFPVAFEPSEIQLGARRVRCVDGGTVNDSPVKYALGGDGDIDRVFVLAPFPKVRHTTRKLHGVALLSHLLDVLIEERLFRDLREAHEVNRALRALERALPIGGLRERALGALGWEHRHVVEVIEIRPPAELEGDAFAGFFSRRLREDYVQAGAEAARAALAPR
jgi:predicted acylesterase/phospholipase RssA